MERVEKQGGSVSNGIVMLQNEPQRYIEYSEERHAYYVDGKEYISVTTVLDLAGFVSPFARDEEARNRGIAVHSLSALDDLGQNKDLRKVPAHLRGYLRAWRKYRQDSGFIPERIEERVDDHKNGYAGRMDRFGFRPTRDPLKFEQVVLDIKTSTSGAIADYTKFQLAAYGNAIDPGKVFARTAVSLRPNGTYNCRNFDMNDYLRDVAEFLQILKRVKSSLCQK